MKKGIITCLTLLALAVGNILAQGSFSVPNTIVKIDSRETDEYSIRCMSTLQVKSDVDALSEVNLNLLNATITTVWVDDVETTDFSYDKDVLTIQLGKTLKKDATANVCVQYIIEEDADFFAGYHTCDDGYSYLGSATPNTTPMNYARSWRPCIDDYTHRTAIEEYIQTDTDKMGLGNGVLLDKTTATGSIADASYKSDKESTVWHWKMSQTVVDYLTNIIIGNYKEIDLSYTNAERTIPINVFVDAEYEEVAKKVYAIVPSILKIMEENFCAYQWDKVGFASTHQPFSAEEYVTNIGMTFAVTESLLYKNTLIHELLHHWSGNLATVKTYHDTWLSEGLTQYLNEFVAEKLVGEYYTAEELQTYKDEIDAYSPANYERSYALSAYPEDKAYDPEVYGYGAWAFRQLRTLLGDELFIKGLKQYFNDYSFKSASLEDFKALMESTTGVDLTDFYNKYVYNIPDATGIQSISNKAVKGSARKYIQNGQFVIDRNGMQYNAVGSRLK